MIAAVAFGVVAAMDPRKPGGGGGVQRQGLDLVVVLDVSKSMLATDLDPNRLAKAKQFIARLIDEMPNDRIGLVWFAGKAYLQMPLSLDHAAAKLYVSAVSTESVGEQGTQIGEALELSIKAFSPREARYKTIVLISDGESHDEEAVQTARELRDQGLMINTVGIGSSTGTTLVDPATKQPKIDENGQVVVSKLNEELLRDLAAATNGVYVHLQDSEAAVDAIIAHLSQIEKKAFPDILNMNFQPYYALFVSLMLLIIVGEMLVPEKRRAL